MAKKAKTLTRKGQTVSIPTNLSELSEAISQLGKVIADVDALQARYDKKVLGFADTIRERALELSAKNEALLAAIFKYAEDEREQLLANTGSKTVTLPTGEVLWRDTPYKVELTEDESVIIGRYEEAGLEQFLTRTVTLNKEAMIDSRNLATSIKGVEIEKGEMIYAKPAGLPEVRTASKVKLPKVEKEKNTA